MATWSIGMVKPVKPLDILHFFSIFSTYDSVVTMVSVWLINQKTKQVNYGRVGGIFLPR